MDERFTTFESLSLLNEIWDKKNIKEKKDSLSAYFILERFLSQKK
jgi:RNase H-fold protein (predicted Holliday junction resolvase)